MTTAQNSAPPPPGWRFRTGDFWDKFRALFIYEARAQIPERKSV